MEESISIQRVDSFCYQGLFSIFRASTLSPGSGHMVQLQKKVRSLEDENLTLKLEVRKTVSFTVQFLYNTCTVDSEIFVRVLFLHNFVYAKFHENKTLAKLQKHPVIYLYM